MYRHRFIRGLHIYSYQEFIAIVRKDGSGKIRTRDDGRTSEKNPRQMQQFLNLYISADIGQ